MSCSRPLHVRIESIKSRLMVSFRMVMDSSISWPAADGGPSASGASGASGRLSMNKNSSTLDRRRWSPLPPPPPPPPGRCRKLYHRSLSDDGDRDAVAVPPCRLCTFRLMVLSSGTATSRWCLPVMVTMQAGRTVPVCDNKIKMYKFANRMPEDGARWRSFRSCFSPAAVQRIAARVVRLLRRYARQCPVRRCYDNIIFGRWPLARVLRTPTAWPPSELYRYAIVSPSIPPGPLPTVCRYTRALPPLRSVSYNLLYLFIAVFYYLLIIVIIIPN